MLDEGHAKSHVPPAVYASFDPRLVLYQSRLHRRKHCHELIPVILRQRELALDDDRPTVEDRNCIRRRPGRRAFLQVAARSTLQRRQAHGGPYHFGLSNALLFGVLAITANPYLVGAMFFLSGANNIVWNIVTVSLRQHITPDRLLGRVNSGYRLLAWGSMPLGAATGGLLAQFLGLRAVFAIMAILTLALLAGMTIVTNDRMNAAERDADTPSAERVPGRIVRICA